MSIFKSLFKAGGKPKDEGEGSGAGSASAEDMTTCLVCHERTLLPQKDPPWGTALACMHCHAPLIGGSQPEEESPLSISAQTLEKTYGMTGRALEHPRCPFCGKINHAVVFPARGQSIAWYAVEDLPDPARFSFPVHCVHCDKDFHIDWDENPLRATCRICGIQTEDALYSLTICKDCVAKASKLRYRANLTQPPGSQVEYIFLVGFGRMPEGADVSALASAKIELAPRLYTLMLTGSMPQITAEIGLITAEVVERNGQKKLGHEVDWGKVTYEGFRDLLLIKFWE